MADSNSSNNSEQPTGRSSRQRARSSGRSGSTRRRGRRGGGNMTILFAIVGVAVVVMGVLIFVTVSGQGGNDVSELYAELGQETVEVNGVLGYALGDEDAAVTVHDFSDYSCPFCYEFSGPFDRAIEEYAATGDVRFIFSPVVFVNPPTSIPAAAGMYCAGEQGKAYEMHDQLWRIFETRSRNGFTETNIVGRARVLELNIDEFTSCYNADSTATALNDISTQASELGVNATPTVFVNEQRVTFTNMELMFDELSSAIEAALAEAEGA